MNSLIECRLAHLSLQVLLNLLMNKKLDFCSLVCIFIFIFNDLLFYICWCNARIASAYDRFCACGMGSFNPVLLIS